MRDNSIFVPIILVSFMFGAFFVVCVTKYNPPHTVYTVNDKTYLVTQSNRTFIETDSIEITYNDKNVLVIKEKK